MNIKQTFEKFKNQATDINEHLETLYQTCKDYTTICEFGTRCGHSTIAFLNSLIENPHQKLTCYDINFREEMSMLIKLTHDENINDRFDLLINDVLKVEPVKCDFLFIDTWHTYNQLKQELFIHVENNPNPPKCLAFHDTETFGLKDENYNGPIEGLLPAILEFLVRNPKWKITHYSRKCNGLIVLKFGE